MRNRLKLLSTWLVLASVIFLPFIGGGSVVAATSSVTPQQQAIAAINAERTAVGAPALSVDPDLANASEWLSQDQVWHNYFSDTDRLGRNVPTRLHDFGYGTPPAWDENIAQGYTSASGALAYWNSLGGYHAAMLDRNVVNVGVGYYQGHWVLDLASHGTSAAPAPTATAQPTATQAPTATVAPTAAPTATQAPTPTQAPTQAPTPTVAPTATQAPTSTPAPTATPTTSDCGSTTTTAAASMADGNLLKQVNYHPLGAITPSGLAQTQLNSTGTPGYIYVATTGNDSTGSGAIGSPYRTIQHGVDMAAAGNTVCVRGGTYTEMVIVNKAGTAASPITIKNYPGETPIIDGFTQVTGWSVYSGNVYRAQFTHNGGKSAEGWSYDATPMTSSPDGYSSSGDRRGLMYVDNTVDSNHWLKPVSFTGTSPDYANASLIPAGAWGSDVTPPPGPTYANATNYVYVNLSNLSDPNPNNHTMQIAAWESQFYFGPSASYITVHGFTLRGGMHGVFEETANNITVEWNDVSLHKLRDIDIGHTGITGWGVSYNTIHDSEYEYVHIEADNSYVTHNTMSNTIAPWSYWGSMGMDILGNSINVADNEVFGIKKNASNGHGGHGIMVEQFNAKAQSDLIQRNKIHGNDNHGIYLLDGDFATVKNNLIYDNGGHGITLEAGSGDSNANSNYLYNNTITHNTGNGINITSGMSNNVVRDDIVWSNGGGIVNSGTGSVIDTNVTANPLFVNETSRDLHLTSGSPARNTGSNVGVTDDFDTHARPMGTGYDIGAYEYVE